MNPFNPKPHPPARKLYLTFAFQVVAALLILLLGLEFWAGTPPSGDPARAESAPQLFAFSQPIQPAPVRKAAPPRSTPTRQPAAASQPGRHIVQQGETVASIAAKYGLQPDSVLWGNPDVLFGNPLSIRPGMELVILPVDGLRYRWREGDRLWRIAWTYGAPVEAIAGWNGLSLDENGDAPITPGTWLTIPGGQMPLVDRRAMPPADPESWCKGVNDGLIGSGRYIWPTPERSLSGYNFAGGHNGIDIGGEIGDPVAAIDDGVVIAAGGSTVGYGRMVVVDHGNGWYSLYAHLDQIIAGCGQAVYQGDLIGELGTTGNSSGPHLHLEIYDTGKNRIDPLSVLPAP